MLTGAGTHFAGAALGWDGLALRLRRQVWWRGHKEHTLLGGAIGLQLRAAGRIPFSHPPHRSPLCVEAAHWRGVGQVLLVGDFHTPVQLGHGARPAAAMFLG